MGGVRSGRDALELLAAGASGVALGTVLFAEPDAPRRVRAELDAELAALGLSRAEDAVGLAHEQPAPIRQTLDHGLRVSG
jgi:dihydroorotate dehydrogenase (NAD+) catalytic subunit